MSWNFDPPGNVNDFNDPAIWNNQLTDVSRQIIQSLAAEIIGKSPEDVTDAEVESLREQIGYVDPTKEEPPATAETVNIQAWGGFPRAAERRDWSDIVNEQFDPNDPDGRYRAVEMLGDEDHQAGIFVNRFGNRLDLPVRHRQDEYLEWAVANDGRSIAFVSEGYDYFAELFRENPQRVVELYHEFTGDESITADDLRAPEGIYRLDPQTGNVISRVAEPGDYNPRNIHNIKQGIVHLSHRANSLQAEVFLAGTSAIARTKADNSLLSGNDSEELLCCNLGGAPNRNSDPIISQAGYRLILGGKRYTLANPVGLYIADVEFDSLLLPNNRDVVPRDWWHAVRGDGFGDPRSSRVLRLELRIPQTETFNNRPLRLSDLKIGGGNLAYPGQLAELIKVHLFVTLWDRSGGGSGPSTPCIGTCCQQSGTPLLRPSRSGCQPPLTDAFPGLITPVTVVNSMVGRSASGQSDSRTGSM